MGKISDYENVRDFDNKMGNVGERQLQDKYKQYKNMNNHQLNQELMNEVARQKMNGTFDYSQLEKMVDGLRGALPEENYNKIKGILKGLDDNQQNW